MQYAPVVIPTLNRKVHLSRCIESLANNTLASYTEIYISVDYPPTKEYEKGYLEVKKYLENFDKTLFKKIYVIYQKENLGVKKNIDFLLELISKKFDRYIFTEDDNEFSNNFLEYVNKGLEIFKDDKNVMGICGAKDISWIHENPDVNFAKLFPAYGFGTWFDKEQKFNKEAKILLLDKKNLKIRNMIAFAKKNRCLFDMYICDVLCTNRGLFWQNNELYWCDSIRSMYMHLTEAVCVVPVKAKSRTWGNDGSGVNMAMREIDPEKEWPLDDDFHFEYVNIENMSFNEKNYKLGNQYLKYVDNNFKFFQAIVYSLFLLICGKEREYIAKVSDFLKNFMER